MLQDEKQKSTQTNQMAITATYDAIQIKNGNIKMTVEFDLKKNAHLLEKLSNESGNPVMLGIAFQQQEMDV
ncbi:hypothetical protein [Leuconostoc carnosum]|uniref:hypothetical protein n=2 Tax=Leuconostoc carnosum TaxID=1252 RepID=UPI001239D9BC|nr:hypothetical protein [Leuconostoc carnosum]KAA8327810.1 hypothetical protein FE409_07225 [Leuconostoc carnosum]KAA8368479.1 hypothetical protein FE416_01420 [Leuconostoc carnosum]KAA8375276.1 hypothetical protein FE408_07280 [Leuconostoc carnosum]